ncbi:MAG: 23S rRNA (pseudouridine(1915)-N(3))-methyltransferase RlmH [Lachnospiraceae bacterium]|nr:23S rRNA (pseudouridine(1915)-N(3))-methyltransferase RlmH [Lachnospiraceae bacterium]
MNFNIKLVVVGKVKEDFYRKKLEEYYKSISKKNNFQVVELSDESIPSNPSQAVIDKIKIKEGDKILQQIKGNDYVIALCIDGKSTDLSLMKKQIEKARSAQCENVVFIIGGSLGLDEKVVNRANYKMSFSNMTFPHQLMRVMLSEQIEKAVS